MIEIKEVSVLDGARWHCVCSGCCCGGYLYGPIEDEVAERIENHRFSGNAHLIYPQGPFETAEIHGERVRVLRRVNGRCVFQSEDRLCVIHKELGFDAKPAMCRIYPLNVTLAPDGVAYVSLNMECEGFSKGCKGPLLAEEIGDQLDLLVDQATLFVSEEIYPRTGQKISFDAYLDRFERPWLDRLESDGPWLKPMIADVCGDAPEAFPKKSETIQFRNEILNKIEELSASEAQKSELENDAIDAGFNRSLLLAVERLRGGALSELLFDREVLRAELQNAVFGKAFLRAHSLLSALGFEAVKLALAAQLLPENGDSARALAVVNRCLRFSSLANLEIDETCERYAVGWMQEEK